ncbi:hypothetical protein KVG88_17265 [Pseudomonas sp. SWRI74]|jgi:hypothetical protein|uniref:Peptidase M12B domain-containing protein n=1 Tax=Pseudomonas azerbaijanoccidentalis TaxID=2842347 RepID=A0ABS6QSC1_9PSED|nr:hypothetical protein [Pseudomonas azerbaijanoccidentalis]MBV4521814.1 hypothetical protein [Pseudomonas azerbaijanoccidentalis]MCK8667791.1 hypothetical protein [Pseudomonas azerbaijanoccidentalis]
MLKSKISVPLLLLAALTSNSAHATIAIDDTPWPAEQPQPKARSLVEPLVSKMPIFIYAFIHDDVLEPQSDIYTKHFLPMVKEIEGFTGRRVSIQFIRNLRTFTDFNYEHENEQTTYLNWYGLASYYRDEKNLPRTRTTKFLLITKNALNNRVAGIAGLGQQTGIASLKSALFVGHEIGHMLDADHEHGDVLFRNGWWCDSYMVPSPNLLNANCHFYTDANQQRISDFLSNVP